MVVTIYGDSLLKLVLWENGKYISNHQLMERFADEFGLQIINRSGFGFCVTKGLQRIRYDLKIGKSCDYAVLEFGGNDCSFDWQAIAASPGEEHDSAVPLNEYLTLMRTCIRELREAEIKPILTNMLPFDPKTYLDWVTRSLDRELILRWLGEENRVYRKNEQYCRQIEKLAGDEGVPLVDIRSAFLAQPKLMPYYCADGIHPNREGQELIYRTFADFVRTKIQ